MHCSRTGSRRPLALMPPTILHGSGVEAIDREVGSKQTASGAKCVDGFKDVRPEALDGPAMVEHREPAELEGGVASSDVVVSRVSVRV